MNERMMMKHVRLLPLALTFALTFALPAFAQTSPAPVVPATISGQLPSGTSAARWAGNTLYVSGTLDPDIATHHDTKSQTVGLINALQKILESQKLTLGDVVMMHVYLSADPAKDNKMDFEGMMAGYTQFFGTPAQPNKPARTTVQVVLPAGARGGLIEIDLVAIRAEGR